MAIAGILSMIVGGVGSIASSQAGATATEEAAKIQSGLLDEATQLQMDFLGQNRTDILDAVAKGEIDLQEGYTNAIAELRPVAGSESLNRAVDLIRDPSGVQTHPQTEMLGTAGEAATAGVFGDSLSPSMLAESSSLGRNMAATRLSDIIRRMTPSINREVAGSQAISNLESSRGSALANLRAGGVSNVANVTGAAVPGIANSIEGVGNVAAARGINQANVSTALAQNLANLGYQGAQLFSGGT